MKKILIFSVVLLMALIFAEKIKQGKQNLLTDSDNLFSDNQLEKAETLFTITYKGAFPFHNIRVVLDSVYDTMGVEVALVEGYTDGNWEDTTVLGTIVIDTAWTDTVLEVNFYPMPYHAYRFINKGAAATDSIQVDSAQYFNP